MTISTQLPDSVSILCMDSRFPRSAHATIRGYLYQTCLGVLRWLDLKQDECLVCEGDEDLDRYLLGGTVISEQVKAYSGRLGLGDRVVLDSLMNFLRTYVALRKEEKHRKFLFTTTAEPRKQTRGLDFDLLEKWQSGLRTPEVIEAVRCLLDPKEDGRYRDEILDARTWLDRQPEGWLSFIDAVEWTFKAPDLEGIRSAIRARLAQGGAYGLPFETLTDRLVAYALEASSRPNAKERTLTPTALSELIQTSLLELERWAESQRGRRIREVFDEVARLQRLLNTGAVKLRDLKPGTLLTAAHEVIPFEETGRKEELDLLADWCQDAEPRSILLLIGEGGSGKTRLMIEWCRRLRHQGWHAGFLRRDRKAAELDPVLEGTAPRLVVVDYAETQVSIVNHLMQKLASAESGEGPKVRVVLLARRGGDWWLKLSESDGEIARLPGLSQTITPLVPSDSTTRREIFLGAMVEFAAQTGKVVPEGVRVPDLSHNDYEHVLLLHMAALAALDGNQIDNAAEALRATLVHERRFWIKQVADLGLSRDLSSLLEEGLETAVAAVTLAQGTATSPQTHTLLERSLKHLRLQPHHPGTILGLLRTLYGGGRGEDERYIDPLQPDLLGEELIKYTLFKDENFLTKFLDDSSREESYNSLTVLTRIAQRDETRRRWLQLALGERLNSLAQIALDVAVETGDPIGIELAQQLEATVDEDIIIRIQWLCDEPQYRNSLPLMEVGCIATERALALLSKRHRQPRGEDELEYIRLTINLCTRLNQLGRFSQALQVIQDGVIKSKEIDVGRDLLIKILTNLGETLRELGRYEEAAHAHQEAINLCRESPQLQDKLDSLASGLINLGLAYGGAGKSEEALAALQEAAEICQQLLTQQSGSSVSTLALSLLNMSRMLVDLGQREAALYAAQESVVIFGYLAEKRPDSYRRHLAASFMNFGKMLNSIGLLAEALHATDQAVQLYRKLARQRPTVFTPELSMSLNNLGKMHNDLGDVQNAVAATREAIEIRRRLCQSSSTLLPDLAMSLTNLGAMLSEGGDQVEEGHLVTVEAIEIYRQIDSPSSTILLDFSLSLINFGMILFKLGRLEEGLPAIQEAIDISRRVAQERPDAALPYLAMGLSNLGLIFSALGRHLEAYSAAEEAIKTISPLFLQLPSAFANLMGSAIVNYVHASRGANKAPNEDLLTPILETFNALQSFNQSESA
jgi:tetratricopeptide (TPR) repeat protein